LKLRQILFEHVVTEVWNALLLQEFVRYDATSYLTSGMKQPEIKERSFFEAFFFQVCPSNLPFCDFSAVTKFYPF